MNVNDADRAAAEAAYASLCDEPPSIPCQYLAEHFARHRLAERERIARIIEAKRKQYAEATERSGFQTWRAAADVMLQLAEELKSDQLTKEPSDEAK